MKYFLLFIAILIYSCSNDKMVRRGDPKLIFEDGMIEFNDKNYIEAVALFELIKLQFPASEYAELAQYYTAESEFKQEKYIIAAFNYNTLRRIFPSSKFGKESLFKAAVCYFELSPPFDRDQEYTYKAITSFQEFQFQYPGDSLTAESDKYIDILRNKLAEGTYNHAFIYRKLDSPRSALIYYDEVINKFDDSKFYEDAYFGKIECLISLRRYDEALGLIDLYKKIFKESKNSEKIVNLADISQKRKTDPNYKNVNYDFD